MDHRRLLRYRLIYPAELDFDLSVNGNEEQLRIRNLVLASLKVHLSQPESYVLSSSRGPQ